MRGLAWFTQLVNNNPKVSLDELIKRSTTAICPVTLVTGTDLYFEIPNEAIEKTTSNYDKNYYLTYLKYKLKFNLGGTLTLKLAMNYTVPNWAQNGGKPSFNIYKNDSLYQTIRAIHASEYQEMSTDIEIDKDDVLSFALYGGFEAMEYGASCKNTLYLQANSMKLYGAVVNQLGRDGIEVSDQ